MMECEIINKKDLYEDQATNCYNKNYFIKNIATLSKQMIKDLNNNTSWCILFCDIDGLKIANDTIGHIEADKGIKFIAETISKNIRTKRKYKDKLIRLKSIAIRFGGDEFIIIMPRCEKDKVNDIINRIKNKIIENKKESRNMTLSIGYAHADEIEYADKNHDKELAKNHFYKVIELAEKRMYKDKNERILSLSYKQQKEFVLKHLARVSEQIGIDHKNNDNIDLIIKILKEIKKTNK